MITILPSGQHLSVKMERFHCVPSSCSREHLQRSMRAVELVYTFAVIKPSQARCMQHLLIWPRVRSRSCRGHRAPCWSHKLRQRFPVLCMHQHMRTPLPSNVRQEDEFRLDRGTWWGLALAWLCVCDSSLAVVRCCIKPSPFVTFSTSQFGLHPPKIFSMFFFLTRKIGLHLERVMAVAQRNNWNVCNAEVSSTLPFFFSSWEVQIHAAAVHRA